MERLSRDRFLENINNAYANKAKVQLVFHYINCYGILEKYQESQ